MKSEDFGAVQCRKTMTPGSAGRREWPAAVFLLKNAINIIYIKKHLFEIWRDLKMTKTNIIPILDQQNLDNARNSSKNRRKIV